jgi:hypothetical protein
MLKRSLPIQVSCLMVFMLFGGGSAYGGLVPQGDNPSVDSQMHDDLVDVLASARSKQGPRGPSKVQRASVSKFVTTYVPACSLNGPNAGSGSEALCANALSSCEAMGESGVLYWIYRRAAGASGLWEFVGQVCRSPAEVPEAVVPVFTAEDFRRLPLPAGGVHVEPPNLRTLINVPTNVYVDADRVIIPTELLGFPVRVRATPARFIWRFGDGGKLATTDAGAPYPDLRTTHTYTRPGRARVRLTTVYSGEYSVAGGPWLPIDGTAQVDSPGRVLTVLAAENRLVVE